MCEILGALKLSRLEVILTFIVEYGVERVFPKNYCLQ